MNSFGMNNRCNIDSIIEKLLAFRSTKPMKDVNLDTLEIQYLCKASKDILLSESIVLEPAPPLNICGDIHGQFNDLLRIFDKGGYPPNTNYLFLGDYVDRGKQSIETICLLLAYKIKYPEKLFLLRGNHESAMLNRIYGFFDDCNRRYSVKIWKTFLECFDCLPVVAIIKNKIFCCHGGLSPELRSIDDIRNISRPISIPEHGLLCDLLWSDPSKYITTWGANSDRQVSFVFGEIVVNQFLDKHGFDLFVRAHQMVQDGYEFFANNRLVTIFSAPKYCDEYDNDGAVMSVNDELLCTFFTI